MKILYILTLVLFPVMVNAKTPCDKITSTTDKLRGVTIRHSSFKNTIAVSRIIHEDGRDSSFISVTITIPAILDYTTLQNLKGIYFLFESGAYRDENAIISSMPIYAVNKTVLSGRIYLAGSTIDSFKNNIIRKAGISGFDKEIPNKTAVVIPEFIECINK